MKQLTAVDELMQHCKARGLRRPRRMSRFLRFHKKNPHLLDFLLQELKVLKENNWATTSFEMLWHHARWVLTYDRVGGEQFAVCQNLMPHYSRAAIILCPEFNGFYRLKTANADKDFGLRIGPRPSEGGLRRLVWADGTPIETGWRPAIPHVIPDASVPRRRPVQRLKAMRKPSQSVRTLSDIGQRKKKR